MCVDPQLSERRQIRRRRDRKFRRARKSISERIVMVEHSLADARYRLCERAHRHDILEDGGLLVHPAQEDREYELRKQRAKGRHKARRGFASTRQPTHGDLAA
jgi:hypothetical protein